MKKTILFAVTLDLQLQFLDGIPQELVQRGWEVHIVSSSGPRGDSLARVPGVQVHVIEMRREPSLLADMVAASAWTRVIRVVRPSIVVIGTPKASLVGLAVSALYRVPRRIYILHGLRLETARGWRKTVLSFLERLTITLSTRVFAVGSSLRDLTLKLGLVSPSKIMVIAAGTPNGIDTAEFDSDRFTQTTLDLTASQIGLRANQPVVGFVGRLTRDKGLADLERAMVLLRNSGIALQLLLVGKVDDKSGDIALERLRAIGINVVSTGHVERPAIYYQLMDVFCLPSLREGFSTVALEASSSGVPVVVSTATGAIDAVRAGQTGLVFQVGDSIQLAQQIEAILEDKLVAREMGDRGRRWVRDTFGRHAIQTAFIEEYESLVR